MLFRSGAPALRAISRASGSSSTLPRSLPRSLHFSSPPQAPNPSSRSESAWAAATESAHSVLTPPPSSAARHDPLAAIHAEIGSLKDSLFQLLGSSHPALDTIAKYYFHAEGKHLRPLIVLLMSQATNGLAGPGWTRAREEALAQSVDDSLTVEGGVLNDWNPEVSGRESGAVTFGEPFRIPNLAPLPPRLKPTLQSLQTSLDDGSPQILPTQRRLASITEMIHVASLLHDDVIDTSPLRRGQPSAPNEFGNKLSILSGDFLLGRASVALARLGSREVVELLATVIANLVEGEVMQLRATSEPERIPTKKGFEDYMRKTYLKTASLMAKSARAAVILGGSGRGEAEWVKEVAYGYGRNLGIAFQLVDDALDFLPPDLSLGKPGEGADLKLGLATAPALFAWEEHPELGPLILRKFSESGDVKMARDIVGRSKGLERTMDLARKFAGEARGMAERLPESEARGALVGLTEKVVDRVK
ncbi:trans-hexaprenyltranstransferase [Dioszegia hungarica]|uniref:(2E,6E)-farnesyl diphosphate synthase n=1 Tax=Dioszegia hungarica TaxID=4972 RepID=A0AA38HGZ0_9TREE|nr:trans-hexaprenyltranstransferase [Dioszegia hungarica]KAI9638799.1 trans-hexaprenyltranstransferase [Dioszegia hungarica]